MLLVDLTVFPADVPILFTRQAMNNVIQEFAKHYEILLSSGYISIKYECAVWKCNM